MKPLKLSAVCAVLLALVLLLGLAGCADPNASIEQLALVVTAEDISMLDDYPNLKEVDLRGSNCYDAIEAYIASHPEIEVSYTVDLGRKSFETDETELTLKPGDFAYEKLMENLKYLPRVTHIELVNTSLTLEEIEAIKASYGAVTVDYTVELLGAAHSPAETALDLSGMEPSMLDDTAAKLPMLPNVTHVELMKADGTCNLSPEDVKVLQEAAPGVVFNYTFELFGQTLSTAAETVEYVDVAIGNEGEPQIRQALDILTNCTYFKLDNCGLDYEVLAGIRDDYPDTKVVWRVELDNGHYSMLTDEEMLRITHRLNNENSADLKYCTGVKYADFGHNSSLTDISFIQYMTELECLILSGSPLKDISYLENCTKLVWLELCFCGNVSDLSSLSGLKDLRYLNVSYSKVEDISPIQDLQLERFNCMHTKVSTADAAAYEAAHPNCLSRFEGEQPYGYGWRYNDYGYTFFDYYLNMRKIFRYDDTSYYGNRKE